MIIQNIYMVFAGSRINFSSQYNQDFVANRRNDDFYCKEIGLCKQV